MNSSNRVDLELVKKLISEQFPQWKDLPIVPWKLEGKGNHAFRLGNSMIIRLPKTAKHALQVEKEGRWLPQLAPLLPLPIPKVAAIGKPSDNYPWHFVIYHWIEGEIISPSMTDLKFIAKPLALFLKTLHGINLKGGPLPGSWGSNRGGPLNDHHREVSAAIQLLNNQKDSKKIEHIWLSALKTRWESAPLWIHADITASNLLVQKEKLVAVIDFGKLVVGDPAYDLSIAWIFFDKETRSLFQQEFSFDQETWLRAKAWAMRKALVHASGLKQRRHTFESLHCFDILKRILVDPL